MNEPSGVVLSAGYGTRLRPLTDRIAKPALPFLNKPILHWALDSMEAAGVARIAVNTHYLAEQVAQCALNWGHHSATEIVISHEDQLMGTGGGVRQAWEALGEPNGPLVVMNGDGVAAFDLRGLIEKHLDRAFDATLLCARTGEGRIFIGEDGRTVVDVPGCHKVAVERSEEISFCGISILNPPSIRTLPHEPGCLLRNGLCRTVPSGRVGAAMTTGQHWDLGTPQRYWDATRLFLAESVQQADSEQQGQAFTAIPPVLISPDCSVGAGAVVGPNVVLGGGAELTENAVVRNSVVFGKGRVGDTVDRIVVSGATLELA